MVPSCWRRWTTRCSVPARSELAYERNRTRAEGEPATDSSHGKSRQNREVDSRRDHPHHGESKADQREQLQHCKSDERGEDVADAHQVAFDDSVDKQDAPGEKPDTDI